MSEVCQRLPERSMSGTAARLHWRLWGWLQWCYHPEDCFHCGSEPEDTHIGERCGYCGEKQYSPPSFGVFLSRDLKAQKAFSVLEDGLKLVGRRRMDYCQVCGVWTGRMGGKCGQCQKYEFVIAALSGFPISREIGLVLNGEYLDQSLWVVVRDPYGVVGNLRDGSCEAEI